MSTLFVNNISHTNDTAALAINTTGTITPSKMVYATFGLDGNNHAATAAGYEVIDNWTTLSSPHTTVGATMSHSSGIFTFPHTGKFLIQAQFQCQASGGNRTYAGGSIQYSSDSGVNFSKLTRSITGIWTDGGWATSFCQVLIEITNVSTQRIRFNSYVAGNTSIYTGDNGTQCTFQQVG